MKIVDVHSHGIDGYDTRTTNPDHVLKIAILHGSRGVNAVVPTIYPGPVEWMRQNMAAVKGAMKQQASAYRNSPSGPNDSRFASIEGIHLEGPFLNPSRPGALNRTFFQKPSQKTWKRLIEGFEDIVKIVTLAPELQGAPALIKELRLTGIRVSLGHSNATYAQAEKGFCAGATGITHLFNAMRGFHHREPGIAGFGLANPDMYVEIIADPFHLHKRVLDVIFALKNPDKILIVSDSVKETSLREGRCPVKDANKTLQGGSMTITASSRRLIDLGFNKTKVMACITSNPCSYLGLPD